MLAATHSAHDSASPESPENKNNGGNDWKQLKEICREVFHAFEETEDWKVQLLGIWLISGCNLTCF